MEITCLEVSTQRHLNRMQETTKVNYNQYGRGSKTKGRPKAKPSGGSGSSGGRTKARNTGKSSKLTGKGKKPPLPTNMCWRCGKPWHQKKKHCKALDATCRGCGTKGHYEKVCMKKSAHLVGVPDSTSSSDTEYFDEHGQPVYVHALMVHTVKIKKEETSDLISYKCQLRESEETRGRPLSYCSSEDWHRSRCKPSQLIDIWQNNWGQIATSTLYTLDGSIWKFHGIHTCKVLCIPEVER